MVLVRGRDSVDRIPSDGQPRSRSGLGSVAGGRLLPHRAYEARWRRLADARRIRPSRPACACILTNDTDDCATHARAAKPRGFPDLPGSPFCVPASRGVRRGDERLWLLCAAVGVAAAAASVGAIVAGSSGIVAVAGAVAAGPAVTAVAGIVSVSVTAAVLIAVLRRIRRGLLGVLLDLRRLLILPCLGLLRAGAPCAVRAADFAVVGWLGEGHHLLILQGE